MTGGPLGRFLELALPAPDLLTSWQTLRALGFNEAVTTDARPSGYAVLGDGRCALGLHAGRETPELVFVRPDVLAGLDALAGIDLGERSWHGQDGQSQEVRCEFPGGMALRMLEARTYSPISAPDCSSLGWFSEVMVPVAEATAAARYWEAVGFVCLGESASPLPHLVLTSDTLNLGLYSPAALARVGLLFEHPQPADVAASLERAGLATRRPPAMARQDAIVFALPEGTPVWVVPEVD
jgi:hypothetical protein